MIDEFDVNEVEREMHAEAEREKQELRQFAEINWDEFVNHYDGTR